MESVSIEKPAGMALWMRVSKTAPAAAWKIRKERISPNVTNDFELQRTLTNPTLVPMNLTRKKHAVIAARSFSGIVLSITAKGERKSRPMPSPARRGSPNSKIRCECSFSVIIEPTGVGS